MRPATLPIPTQWFLSALLLFTPLTAHAENTPYFRDVTEEMGLDFVHHTGFTDERLFVGSVGSGGALFDYDGDGDLDLYFVQGNDARNPSPKIVNQLYRNDDGHFVDVTAEAGVGDPTYGMGAVAADYDGDGDQDLYVTNFGPNVLYRNNGDGTFTDVTEEAGVGYPLFSTSAAFADADRDGDLDLYVCNYVEYSLDTDVPCYYHGMRIYCGPQEYAGISDTFYRNNGDGTFTDITDEAGIHEESTRGLGVVFTDVDNDGWLDIYVSDDMTRNLLFMNQKDGTFTEEAVLRGVSYNGDGITNNSMGVDTADYDNDGDPDLFVTNFALEANCLMQNDGDGYYFDVTFEVGLAEPSFYSLGFGTRFLDYDNDGWQDLFVGNGHIWDNVEKIDPSHHYAQPAQLFRNVGGQFVDITEEAGLADSAYVVRGMLSGDIDNDGDTDVVLCQANRPAVILRNEVGQNNTWLRLKLEGLGGNRDAIGARVWVRTDTLTQMREIVNGASYLSGNDMRLLFGLGDAKTVNAIQIRWPDGSMTSQTAISPRQTITVPAP